MKESEMEKGTHVTISDDASYTKKTHTVNDDMMYMQGKKYKIDSVIDTTFGKAGVINGFYWHPGDLIEEVAKRKSHRFHFDTKELIT